MDMIASGLALGKLKLSLTQEQQVHLDSALLIQWTARKPRPSGRG